MLTSNWFWKALAALTLAALAARIYLFHVGLLYGDTAAELSTLLVAALLASSVAAWAAHAASGQSLALAAAALGLGTAAYAVVQLFIPATPDSAAAPACRGTPVQGSTFLAQTTGNGVNARTGPGSSYPQKGRFSGGCTLGFDGFCLGQPIPDSVTGAFDERWLILHRRNELVSSAKVLSQSAESRLGAAPSRKCSDLGGLAPPTALHFTARVNANRTSIGLSVQIRNAYVIGYGLRELGPTVTGGYSYSEIGHLKENQPFFTGTFVTSSTSADLPNGTGSVELAATACLAADVASGRPVVYLVRFKNGRVASIDRQYRPSPADEDQLKRIACAGPP